MEKSDNIRTSSLSSNLEVLIKKSVYTITIIIALQFQPAEL